MDIELSVMQNIVKEIGKLGDDTEAINRVLKWAVSKYVSKSENVEEDVFKISKEEKVKVSDKEIPGIAQITDSGDFELLIRDIKAKSANDAGIRLALIAIYAHEKLTGEKTLSSRKSLTPLLREYRLYTGNIRFKLAHYTGIVRDGDKLSLDIHAKQDAEKYTDEVLNSEIKGDWNPKSVKKKRVNKKK